VIELTAVWAGKPYGKWVMEPVNFTYWDSQIPGVGSIISKDNLLVCVKETPEEITKLLGGQ
jgi:hypothetical protein